MQSKPHVIVGMSGGVDSSVAALLLLEAGYSVSGLFMKNWEEDDDENFCPASIELAHAQEICDLLNIELQQVNFSAKYWERVFSHFLTEYKAGRTPNPDILCNKEIKFKAFLDFALQSGANYIATGHYARCAKQENNFTLLKGLDSNKDQSYFLYALNQQQLAHSLFPIGHLNKTDVRLLAKKAGFPNFNKKDSTGICFIGERRFNQFLSQYLRAKPGKIITPDGTVIGEHEGLMFYTIGQRQGLKIGGRANSMALPWYVVEKDIEGNNLIVAQGQDHPSLFSPALLTKQIHWINGKAPQDTTGLTAKTRYRQTDQKCSLEPLDTDTYIVHFAEPQRAITPGQSVVFYQGDICLGGGIIEGKHVAAR